MAQPSEAFQLSAEDSFLDLLVDTLEGLDERVRAQFLQQFFRSVAQIDVTEPQGSEYWIRILQRRRELTNGLGKKVSLKTAMVDVLLSTKFLRVPILIEYDELKKLQINAATDALTGLYNRRLFDEYFDKELNRAKRYSQQLAVVILDLHKLKQVNDRHGHLQGDHALQIAATTLRTTLRSSDFAFRIGGDEFAVLLPQTDLDQAVTLCRRVRAEYERELAPLKLDIDVTLDFGVVVHPQDGDQKGELMGKADKKLYALKHSGHTPPRVIPLESQPRQQSSAPETPKASSAPPTPMIVPNSEARGSERRKWERVSLAGTKAHAVITEVGQKTAKVTAKVIDLSYGGVAIQFDKAEDIPDQFNAVLHVPILPPVRVVLCKAHTVQLDNGRTRLGCSFVA
jgi:diguanylate cyclase (GGDEF)-like protein